MIDKLKIIDLFFVNLAFWIIFFSPLFSIIDRKKESLEEAKRYVQRRHQGIRFLITMYLLLMIGLLAYLTISTITESKTANILVMALTGVLLVRVLTLRSGTMIIEYITFIIYLIMLSFLIVFVVGRLGGIGLKTSTGLEGVFVQNFLKGYIKQGKKTKNISF